MVSVKKLLMNFMLHITYTYVQNPCPNNVILYCLGKHLGIILHGHIIKMSTHQSYKNDLQVESIIKLLPFSYFILVLFLYSKIPTLE